MPAKKEANNANTPLRLFPVITQLNLNFITAHTLIYGCAIVEAGHSFCRKRILSFICLCCYDLDIYIPISKEYIDLRSSTGELPQERKQQDENSNCEAVPTTVTPKFHNIAAYSSSSTTALLLYSQNGRRNLYYSLPPPPLQRPSSRLPPYIHHTSSLCPNYTCYLLFDPP